MFTFFFVSVSFLIFGFTHIFSSYPIYRILKDSGYDKAWLGWIPLFQFSALMLITDLDGTNTITILGSKFDRNLVKWFPILYLVALIPVIGSIAVVLINIILVGSICRDIYCKVDRLQYRDAVVLGYFSGFQHIVLTAKLYQYLYSWRKMDEEQYYFQREGK